MNVGFGFSGKDGKFVVLPNPPMYDPEIPVKHIVSDNPRNMSLK